MGYSRWSTQAFNARQNYRRQNNQSAFTYDQQVRQSGRRACHPEMVVLNQIRESRDSDDHPESVAIGVIFDVTGSMGVVPQVLQGKLGGLMRTIIQNGYLEHPQVLFGAVGDAYTDAVPLQIGQFESGIEMDDDLGKIFLEGGGGGQMHETYELAMYYFAHKTAIDCYEKRGKKGYLFTIGDEMPYPVARGEQLQALVDSELEDDVPIEAVIAALHKKYEHFHIVPTTSTGMRPDVQERWRELLGERMLILDDAEAVVETIALAVGLCEGTMDDIYAGVDALTQDGYDAAAVDSASRALTTFGQSRALTPHTASGQVPAVVAQDDDGRL